MITHFNIPGIDSFTVDSDTRAEEIIQHFKLRNIWWKTVQFDNILFVTGKFSLLGGKGGFGSNLKANAKKNANSTTSSDLQRDTKTGLKIRDLKRLKKIRHAIKNCDEEEKAKLESKRKKLERAIDYYEKELRPTGVFDEDEFLEETENLMNELQESLQVAYEDECNDSDDSDDDEYDTINVSEGENDDKEEVDNEEEEDCDFSNEKLNDNHTEVKPKFASFFDI